MPFIEDTDACCDNCAKKRRRSCPVLETKLSFSPWFDYCSAWERKTKKIRPELDEEAPAKPRPEVKRKKAKPKPKPKPKPKDEVLLEVKPEENRPYPKVKSDGSIPESKSVQDNLHIRLKETGKDMPLF